LLVESNQARMAAAAGADRSYQVPATAGQAVIVASHDAAAAERADQVLQLRDGRLT